MSAHTRHDLILKEIEKNAKVSVVDLARALDVSEMTVRRDLELLEQAGSLTRVHGGAVSAFSRSYEPPFATRVVRQVDAKSRIGQAAADLLREGETVILDAGTTTLEVARGLAGRRNLRVFTLSLRIAAVLADEPGIELLVSGGTCRPGEHSLIGPIAERTLQGFSFDTLLLTIGGLSLEAGVTEYNLDDAAIKRAAFAQSRRRIAVSDSSKLGKTAFVRICEISELDVLITDKEAPKKIIAEIRKQDVEVILV